MGGTEHATQAIMSFDANKTWTPETLFDAALKEIESNSIRNWATSQKDVWLKILAKAAQSADPQIVYSVSAYIVAVALG